MTSSSSSLFEHAVGFLHTTRQLQDAPYEPLTQKKIQSALAQQHKMRPLSHVVQKLVVEFYTKTNGKYGVHMDDPTAIVSSAMQRKRERDGTMSSSAGDLAASFTANPADDEEQYRKLRIAQLMKASASANQMSSKPCQYFLSRDGCRRGSTCPHSHQFSESVLVHNTVTNAAGFHTFPHGPMGAPNEYVVPLK